jgi:hypothetical protein
LPDGKEKLYRSKLTNSAYGGSSFSIRIYMKRFILKLNCTSEKDFRYLTIIISFRGKMSK